MTVAAAPASAWAVSEGGDDVGGEQGMVAGEDDDGLGFADQVERGADGAAGAVGLGLDDDLGARRAGRARGRGRGRR